MTAKPDQNPASASWRTTVELVAQLGEEDRGRLLSAAKAHRRRQRDRVLRRLSKEILGDLGIATAARLIDDAAQGRRVSNLSRSVRLRLEAELGEIDDIPGCHRIRQIIENA
jgi:hypothetical protein